MSTPTGRSARGASKTVATATSGSYRIQTIARLTGLSTQVLRAWERRYDLVHPARGEGRYREYTDEDLRVLQRARQLLDSGLTIGEIARIGRPALLEARDTESLLPARGADAASVEGAQVSEFLHAVKIGDVAAAETLVSAALHSGSLRSALEEFVRPAMVAVGDLWEKGALDPGVERMATHMVRVPLESMLASANLGLGPVRVLAASAPGDTHAIGALIAAVECARAGHRTIHLAGPLEVEHLAGVAELLRVRFVCLSFVYAAGREKLRSRVHALQSELPTRARLIVGGRGVQGLETELRAMGVGVPVDADEMLFMIGTAREA